MAPCVGYSDASFQSNKDDSKFESSYLFTMNGGIFNQESSKQETIIDSITEVGYTMASKAIKEAVWIKKFITELGMIPSIVDLIPLYYDNNEVIT